MPCNLLEKSASMDTFHQVAKRIGGEGGEVKILWRKNFNINDKCTQSGRRSGSRRRAGAGGVAGEQESSWSSRQAREQERERKKMLNEMK